MTGTVESYGRRGPSGRRTRPHRHSSREIESTRWVFRIAALFIGVTCYLLAAPGDRFVAFVMAVVLGELAARFGLPALALAVALLTFPPGSLARSGDLFVVAWLVVVFMPMFVKPTNPTKRSRVFLFIAPTIAALSIAGSPNASFEHLIIISTLGISIYLLNRREEFSRSVVACISWLIVVCSTSYAISAMLGRFREMPARVIELSTGFDWNVYFPFTPTVYGDRILGPDSEFPRFVLLTPEPGLSVFGFAIALAYFVSRFSTLNAFGLITVVLGALATQSLGVYLSLLAGGGAAAAVMLWRAGKRSIAVTALILGLVGIAALGQNSIEHRVSIHANTVQDRGLGGGSTLAVGNVNLLVGISSYPTEAFFLIAAIICVLVGFAREISSGSAMVLVATLVTATFNEPLQWNFGVWVLLSVHIFATADPPTRRPEVDFDGSMSHGHRSAIMSFSESRV